MPPVKRTNRGKNPRSHIGPFRPLGDPAVEQKEWQKRADQLAYIRRILRTAISEVEQKDCISRAVKITFEFDAKAEQVEALWRLIIRKQDVILVAQTSFGKSLIFQMLPLLVDNALILTILPLNAIGKDQWTKIQELPGANPIMLCAENNSETTLQGIRNGICTHILVSPEIACSKYFRETVLNNPKFKSRVAAVTVDEVHLVIDWGTSFRKSYTILRSIRQVIGDRPWFGCSATLDTETLEKLQEIRAFKDNFYIIRTSIDRPEIAIVRKIIPKNKKTSYNCLYFLIDGATPPCGQDEATRQCTEGDGEVRKQQKGKSTMRPGSGITARVAGQARQSKKPQLAEPDMRVEERAPKRIPTPQNIKKAIVFFDHCGNLNNCVNIIRVWLTEAGYLLEEAAAVVVDITQILPSRIKSGFMRNSRSRTQRFGSYVQPTRYLLGVIFQTSRLSSSTDSPEDGASIW